jgi:exosortase K
MEIEITSACSGFGFFSMACALLLGFASFRFATHQWFRDVPLLLLTVYLFAILVNTFRIVCAVQIRIFTSQWIPGSYDSAIHMTVGMIVFLPALLFFWNLLQRFYEPK